LKKILIANRKGGVGKTTTALNLARGLSLKGKRVLLIDLDTQGHLQYGLGYKKPFKKGIHRALSFGKLDKVIKTEFDVSLIPADINFDISNIPNKKGRLNSILKGLEDSYDFAIIDTPPTSDTLLKNGIVASDYILVPMQTEYLGLVGAIQFLKLFYQMASSLKTNLKLLGVLPTLYNKSIKEHTQIIEKLKSSIGESRVLTPIRKDFELSKSFIVNKPIFDYKKRSRAVKDYSKLTEDILKKIG